MLRYKNRSDSDLGEVILKMEILAAVFLGFIIDLIVGDPVWLYHPVRMIGVLITYGEKIIRKIMPKSKRGEIFGGVIINIFVLVVCFFVPYIILYLAQTVHPMLKLCIEAFMCYQILAVKSLKKESMRVYKCLEKKDINNAKKYLSWIVGRDTYRLSEEQISKAAVETVAENTSDAVIAPLFYMMLGGAPLAFLYKGVNTLDSMIGYKNEKYINFGKFSARVDDIFNFIPAIISAYVMIGAAFILRLNFKNAATIYKRDKKNHSSPNSGRTEAVCAGALGIQLGGDAYYFGKLYKKKTIGDALRSVEITDIKIANDLMYTTSFLSLLLFGLIKYGVNLL